MAHKAKCDVVLCVDHHQKKTHFYKRKVYFFHRVANTLSCYKKKITLFIQTH